jgi:hypothetical protein
VQYRIVAPNSYEYLIFSTNIFKYELGGRLVGGRLFGMFENKMKSCAAKVLMLISVFAVLFAITAANSAATFDGDPDHVLINSADWRDVYSGMVYSNLKGIPSSFLVSTRHSTIILFSFSTSQMQNIEILSSSRNPYVVGYDSIVQGRGFSAREERYNSFNIELAERLPEIRNFIIIDDSYGYDAISVGPYAAVKNAYVLFVNRNNIARAESLLERRQVDSLVIYGNVHREVLNAFQNYNPVIINEGDRYDNNLRIVDMYLDIVPNKRQVILNNGEFIERQLLQGNDPVVFIGTLNVPEQVRRFIADKNIEVGVLIGNELIGTASTIRRQLGINVFVKFAQSARIPGGTIAQVEDLDRFALPRYSLGLEITSARYNELTQTLEITYRNPVEQAIYLRSTITLRGPDQTILSVRGDETPIFVEGNTYRTVVYRDVGQIPDGSEADIFVLFGESRRSLELSLQGTLPINKVSVRDDSRIELLDFYYDIPRNAFMVRVRNSGEQDAYVQLEAVDVLVRRLPQTFGSGTEFMRAGRTAWIRIGAGEFSVDDIEDNHEVRVIGYFGEREDALVNTVERTFDLQSRGTPYMMYIIIIIIIMLIIFAFFAKKCGSCDERNPITAKHCKRCGRDI